METEVIEFVFMLTHNDSTVDDALSVVATLRSSGLHYIGFKDVGATPARQAEITAAAHAAGMEVMLEVVSTSVADEEASLRAAVAAGVDWVLGGTNPAVGTSILPSRVRYCPFPGTVVGHPSVLEGSIESIAAHAKELSSMPGVHGVDLLAYRHATADAAELTRAVVEAVDGPVIAAGSVVAAAQIRALASAGAWGFTIGGAIFEGLMPGGGAVAEQVVAVLAIAADA